MIKLVGFRAQSGNFVPEDKPDANPIPWSNRYLVIISNNPSDLNNGDFGFVASKVKLKTKWVCESLGISPNSSEDFVNEALKKVLNSEIELVYGRVDDDSYKPVGFKVVNAFSSHNK